jgi:hypothetical protein
MNRSGFVRISLVAVSMLLFGAPLAALEKPFPAPGAAQSLLSRPARLEVKDVTVAAALTALRDAAGVNIVFSPSLLPEGRRVSCDCASVTVELALERILSGTGFDHQEMRYQIVIRPPRSAAWGTPVALSGLSTEVSFASTGMPRLVLPSVPAPALADTISGVVVSAESGQPLPNAIVSVGGTSQGALTDRNGRFIITGVDNLATITLQVRLIGYAQTTATVANGAEDVRIAMEQTAVALDAVVVSALGIDRERRALGYSVATVGPEELTVNRTPNLGDALQGKMPGVNVTSMGSGPQGSSKIRIRGQSSFGGNNSPLLVVNGVPSTTPPSAYPAIFRRGARTATRTAATD